VTYRFHCHLEAVCTLLYILDGFNRTTLPQPYLLHLISSRILLRSWTTPNRKYRERSLRNQRPLKVPTLKSSGGIRLKTIPLGKMPSSCAGIVQGLSVLARSPSNFPETPSAAIVLERNNLKDSPGLSFFLAM